VIPIPSGNSAVPISIFASVPTSKPLITTRENLQVKISCLFEIELTTAVLCPSYDYSEKDSPLRANLRLHDFRVMKTRPIPEISGNFIRFR